MVAAELARLRDWLRLVSHFIDEAGFVTGGRISKAGCMVLPTLLLSELAGAMFGAAALVREFPRLSHYAAEARRDPVMGAVWDETAAALAAMRG